MTTAFETAMQEIAQRIGNKATREWIAGVSRQVLTNPNTLSALKSADPVKYQNAKVLMNILKSNGIVKTGRVGEEEYISAKASGDSLSKWTQWLRADNALRRVDPSKVEDGGEAKAARAFANIERQRKLEEVMQELSPREKQAFKILSDMDINEFESLKNVIALHDQKKEYLSAIKSESVKDFFKHVGIMNADERINWTLANEIASVTNKLLKDNNSSELIKAVNPELYSKMFAYAATRARSVSAFANSLPDSVKTNLRKLYPQVKEVIKDETASRFMMGQASVKDLRKLIELGLYTPDKKTTALGKAVLLYHTDGAYVPDAVKDRMNPDAADMASGDRSERRDYIKTGIGTQFRARR